MTSTRIRVRGPSLLRRLARLVLVGALGPLVAAAPIAHADATDDAFLAALTAKGIHFGSPEKAFVAVFSVTMPWFLADMDRYFEELRSN